MRDLEEAADPIVSREQENYVLPRPLKVGDAVLIVSIDKKGVVTKLPDSQGNVEVQAGIIKTRVSQSDLRLSEERVTVNAPKRQRTRELDISEAAKSEVDVRGLSVDEAIIEVDRVIDNAVMRGLEELRVIHGKGTGALRAGLHQHFKRHSNVRSFRVGVYGEGEMGVTIIELK